MFGDPGTREAGSLRATAIGDRLPALPPSFVTDKLRSNARSHTRGWAPGHHHFLASPVAHLRSTCTTSPSFGPKGGGAWGERRDGVPNNTASVSRTYFTPVTT
jgi:hypothetical protein